MSNRLENGIKQLALTVVPHRLLYWLWHLRRRGKPRTMHPNARDIRVIPIQEGANLKVFWNTNPLGPGPAASLYVLDEEILRFSCFGGKTGYMQINPVQVNLALPWTTMPLYLYPPDTLVAHIERSVFELTHNTPAALLTNLLGRIRSFPIDKSRLIDAGAQMKAQMLDLLTKHGSSAPDQAAQLRGVGD